MKWFEDFKEGDEIQSGGRTVTAEQIVAFAREYDPQDFHLDEEAGRRTHFGGLVASGWQTAAIAMRLSVDALGESSSIGSPGVDELRWLAPVRPGDTLSLRSTVLEARPSRSKADRGSVRVRHELSNQNGVVVLTMTGIGLFLRRPQEA